MTYDEIDGGNRFESRDRHRRGCGGAMRRARLAVRRRTRLTRASDDAILAGVCAGLAHHLGLRAKHVRIATIVALILFTVPTLVAYGLIAWLAPARADLDSTTVGEDDRSGQRPTSAVGSEPGSVEGLARLKNRFKRLEEKFADIEAQMIDERPA